jgi:hypothetical protein
MSRVLVKQPLAKPRLNLLPATRVVRGFSLLMVITCYVNIAALVSSSYNCRVSEKGTLQLSIDADSVRRLLLELPRAARPLDDEAESAPYAHYVEREMAGAVNLVKVMQVSDCRT